MTNWHELDSRYRHAEVPETPNATSSALLPDYKGDRSLCLNNYLNENTIKTYILMWQSDHKNITYSKKFISLLNQNGLQVIHIDCLIRLHRVSIIFSATTRHRKHSETSPTTYMYSNDSFPSVLLLNLCYDALWLWRFILLKVKS